MVSRNSLYRRMPLYPGVPARVSHACEAFWVQRAINLCNWTVNAGFLHSRLQVKSQGQRLVGSFRTAARPASKAACKLMPSNAFTGHRPSKREAQEWRNPALRPTLMFRSGYRHVYADLNAIAALVYKYFLRYSTNSRFIVSRCHLSRVFFIFKDVLYRSFSMKVYVRL